MPGEQQGPFDNEVGRRVRALRLEKGMSLEKLREQLELALRQLQEFEHAADQTGAGTLQRMAEMLGVPIGAFGDAPGVDATGDNLIELIDTGLALRLLRAYARIRSPSLQRALMNLAEEMAAETQL